MSETFLEFMQRLDVFHKAKLTVEHIEAFAKNCPCTLNEACKMLDIPYEEYLKFVDILNDKNMQQYNYWLQIRREK